MVRMATLPGLGVAGVVGFGQEVSAKPEGPTSNGLGTGATFEIVLPAGQ